jgi:site-specific DNA recombinase
MRVAIYARLSRNRDGESTSIERQVAACRKRMEPGWVEAKVYRDDDISAYSGKVRPAFEDMVAEIKAGNIDIVLAYALDRLGRRPKDIERLLESGVRFICIRESLDTTTAASELFVRILAAMAKMESDNTAARIRLKHDELRSLGRFSGGKQPYGWKPYEADIIRAAADRLLAGESLRSVARDLGMERTRLRRRLLTPRIVGKREPDGPSGMPEILPIDKWRKVQAILTDPHRVPPKGGTHLLTGLLECGVCGNRLYHKIRYTPKAWRSYECKPSPPGCNKVGISARAIESLVRERAWAKAWDTYRKRPLRASLSSMKKADERKRKELLTELSTAQEKLYALLDMFTAGDLTMEEWKKARATLDARIVSLEQQLEKASSVTAADYALPSSSDDRDWLAQMIEKVVVKPAAVRGRRFDESRVEIYFR